MSIASEKMKPKMRTAFFELRYTLLAGLSFILILFSFRGLAAQERLLQLVVDYVPWDVEWSPNGERIAVAFDGGIAIYTDTLQEIVLLPTEDLVMYVSWSADSNGLASTGLSDPAIKIWRWDASAATFTLDRIITNHHGYSWAMAAVWSPDGRWLAILAQHQPPGAAYIAGTVEIWDTQTWTLRNSLVYEHKFQIDRLAWNTDSTQIAGGANVCINNEFIACDLPYFYIADAVTGELIYQSQIYIQDLFALAWANDNLLAVGEQDHIQIVDTSINQIIARLPNRSPNGYGILELDWNSNGKYLVTANFRGGIIDIINTETGERLLQLSTGGLNGIDLSPDDTKIASINSQIRTIEIWDVSQLPSAAGAPTLTPLPTLIPSPTP